ncbi:hypothetical protein L7F22_021706 [Adiantum nelumboides]|nr:hypothetical protein [Adiantum nelumboides]
MESCPETEQCSTSTPDKGKKAVRAVRVSKVVSALMLNANTNVSVPVNLSNQVLSLLGFVGNHPLNVLVDSGCSTNFVSTMLVSKLRLPTQQSVEAFQVELANGSYLQCNKKVQQLEFQIQDYKDQLGFSVMPLSHYDMILGQSWLYQYDPIISFRDHSIRLFHRNQEVELRGLFNTQPITMVSAMQVKRLARKRDCTTALVMLREAEDDTKAGSKPAHSIGGGRRSDVLGSGRLSGAKWARTLDYIGGVELSDARIGGTRVRVSRKQVSIQSQELEADHIGLLLMAAAGYDPRVAPHVYEKLGEMTKASELLQYVTTHPSGKKRGERLKKTGTMEEALRIYEERTQGTVVEGFLRSF